MKALILAAGLGTRLAPITDAIPKCLVRVNGKPIIIKQIENLHENGVTNITVVSGYKADVLEKAIHEKYPKTNIIESVDYANTNNMYSAYVGQTAVNGGEFIMMNADVFFDASVVEVLLAFESANAIVVDVGRYIEESMKVIEKNGRLVEISKNIKRGDALGTSIDVYRFSEEGGNAFFAKCAEYIEDKKELKKWSEVALNAILSGCTFRACPLVGRWFEIDNHEDLAAAEELFAN